MNNENLKAVLTEEELGFISEFTAIGGVFTKIISRLADEVVRLRDQFSLNPDGSEKSLAQLKTELGEDGIDFDSAKAGLNSIIDQANRIRELEAQVTALKKLDDDNNADSVRRLKQMEEDKRTIKELQAKLKAWEKEAK